MHGQVLRHDENRNLCRVQVVQMTPAALRRHRKLLPNHSVLCRSGVDRSGCKRTCRFEAVGP